MTLKHFLFAVGLLWLAMGLFFYLLVKSSIRREP